MGLFKIKIFIICFFTFIAIESQASAVYEIENPLYLECNTCLTTTEFQSFGLQHFENNFSEDINQFYAYTMVNESAQLAGGIGGLTGDGSGSWAVLTSSGGGGVFGCTSVNGDTPVYEWKRF